MGKSLAICIFFASVALSACSLVPRGPVDPDEATAYYGVHLYADKDFDAAFEKIKPWADKGNATGLILIGNMYFDGKGTRQDDIMAYVYVTLGINRAEGDVRERAIAFREEIAGGMSAGEIIEAQRRIRRWRPVPAFTADGLMETEPVSPPGQEPENSPGPMDLPEESPPSPAPDQAPDSAPGSDGARSI